MRLGFLGLGVMGTPMALNLARAFRLIVWNRSSSKYPLLKQAGAQIAQSPSEVTATSNVIFTMLFDENAIRATITDDVKQALGGKVLVNCGSVSVDFNQFLAEQVRQAGGDFVEMPVSGSKIPAEQGNLVGMMAGDRAATERIRPFIEPMTKAAIYCGPVGCGLKMKYAVNSFLISMTAGLAEATNLAQAQGLDLESFGQVLEAGPMASAYSKLKVTKMLNQDWAAQATLKDCYNITKLVRAAAEEANTRAPIMQLCNALYAEANDSGLGEEDMIAVMKLFQPRQHDNE
ncbi:uncharacterized protein E0L32_004001 [Thyridium curvatum]|uniref:Uncharacterized protein n=1 Tax=Thyridium curvatum TaxID=1093900 RepID=A0A507B246_9PEZI|nr:uncharacterized protein E0L32_004001 [Thyridium curvatum]TPX16352.1 hypothetical protein E0L32_004001 [Thyridium curvatum]